MISNFKFWCQKVLPLVYDDSLSYYEVLCKITEILNEVIDQTNDLEAELAEFKKFVDATYVTKYDLKFNRFLDETGHFTGYLQDKSVACVLATLTDCINNLATGVD